MPRRPTARRRAVAILLLFSQPGACYRLVPLDRVEPRAGQDVSAALSDQASLDYRGRLGPDVVRVDGHVAWSRPDSIRLLLRRVEQRNGSSVGWLGEPVTFARHDLASFGSRRLDRRRSWWTAAALTALVVLGGSLARGGSSGGEGPTPPPYPPL